jgi:hypothetical protein
MAHIGGGCLVPGSPCGQPPRPRAAERPTTGVTSAHPHPRDVLCGVTLWRICQGRGYVIAARWPLAASPRPKKRPPHLSSVVCRLCPVLAHMMPTETAAGPKRGGASWGFASEPPFTQKVETCPGGHHVGHGNGTGCFVLIYGGGGGATSARPRRLVATCCEPWVMMKGRALGGACGS